MTCEFQVGDIITYKSQKDDICRMKVVEVKGDEVWYLKPSLDYAVWSEPQFLRLIERPNQHQPLTARELRNKLEKYANDRIRELQEEFIARGGHELEYHHRTTKARIAELEALIVHLDEGDVANV